LDELIEGLSNELEDSGLHGIESEMLFKNLQDDLENAIDELPEQRRKIFRMSRFEQMRHKEIALELGISPKTVETQIYRSLNFLREKLKKYLV
jgi:RNA polymerase sigma-70 factor (ECF subfamily)